MLFLLEDVAGQSAEEGPAENREPECESVAETADS
jgi:hypothetical protein